MKHGPIAILDQNVPVLSIAISGDTDYEQNIYLKTLHNAEEARARKSPSLVVACDDNADVDEIFDEVLRIPNVSQIYSPLVAIIPLQFLAYAIAEDLGKDVDQPRNLAKSVTVE
jgi:glucosamine--fructose-6-phosphate aminotransferase (isomerizing)